LPENNLLFKPDISRYEAGVTYGQPLSDVIDLSGGVSFFNVKEDRIREEEKREFDGLVFKLEFSYKF